jgi:acetyltransferase-like isoleucine patch superfamily enzyme
MKFEKDTKGVKPDDSLGSQYLQRCVGNGGFGKLLVYELVTMFLNPLAGAIGYMVRPMSYRMLLGKLGDRSVISRNVTFRGVDRISIGNSVMIDEYACLDVFPKGMEIKIGNNCVINRLTTIATGNFEGAFVRLGSGVNLGPICGGYAGRRRARGR